MIELFGFAGDALRDDATGINALLELLPVADDAPELPDCEVLTALDESWVGRVPLPDDCFDSATPLVLVRQADEFTVGGTAEDFQPAPEVPVLILVGIKMDDTKTALYVVNQVLRTALRSLVLPFLSTPGADASVERHQVEISKPTRVLYPLTPASAGSAFVAAAAVVQFPMYDPWSIGAHVTPSA